MLQLEYTVQTGRWALPGVGTCIQAHTSYILSSADLEASAEGRVLHINLYINFSFLYVNEEI